MSTTIRGNKLSTNARHQALATFIYRNTIENRQVNNDAVLQAGGRLPAITDEQWLAITDFEVKTNGDLCARRSCCTNHREHPEWKALIDKWAADRAALVEKNLNPDA